MWRRQGGVCDAIRRRLRGEAAGYALGVFPPSKRAAWGCAAGGTMDASIVKGRFRQERAGGRRRMKAY